jgi:Holliday junction DNA helicase RuvA
MIGKLRGVIDSISTDHIILDVNGVGYMVYCSIKILSNINIGDTQSFYIDTHVREDHIHLFGFLTLEEKDTYLLLQTVSGVGSKMAIQILSTLTPSDLHEAISCANKDLLRTVSGVGLKLAERLIIELKDKMKTKYPSIPNKSEISKSDLEKYSDAVSALCNLGIQKNDAHNNVSLILKKDPEITLSDLITKALQMRI